MKKYVLTTLGILIAMPVWASNITVPLLAGKVIGNVHWITASPNMSLDDLANRYGVHPTRVEKPKTNLAAGSTPANQRTVDQRLIVPTFYGNVSGIVINIPGTRIYLVEKGKLIAEYPVGVSKTDWKTPIGLSKVVEKKKNPDWLVPDSIQRQMALKGLKVRTKVAAGPENPLGTRWIGFSTGSFGVHGTLDSDGINRYISHGCVRMLNQDVEALFEQVKVGTPVRVYYQPVLMAVEPTHVWMSVYPDTYKLRPDVRKMAHDLATQSKVSDRIDWALVEKALTVKDGIVVDVAKGASTAKPSATAPATTQAPAVTPAATQPPAVAPASAQPPAAAPAGVTPTRQPGAPVPPKTRAGTTPAVAPGI
ncbi:MAG: L,D-transpeptidase [Candidatus Sericytochromatia bacterium]|nr:L,D-transpeptidase [Candidatus Sericytochromatia bacterium]